MIHFKPASPIGQITYYVDLEQKCRWWPFFFIFFCKPHTLNLDGHVSTKVFDKPWAWHASDIAIFTVDYLAFHVKKVGAWWLPRQSMADFRLGHRILLVRCCEYSRWEYSNAFLHQLATIVYIRWHVNKHQNLAHDHGPFRACFALHACNWCSMISTPNDGHLHRSFPSWRYIREAFLSI